MSDTIRLVTTDWDPYYGSELRNGGVITVIVKAAFSKAGVESTIRFVPWKRAIQEVEEGKSDVLMGAYYSHDRARRFMFSQPVYEIKVSIVALKSLGITSFGQLEDLKKYKIGVGRGWVNSEAFDKATYLNKEVASNQILNIRKLFKKRVDMVVMSKGVFLAEYSKLSPSYINNEEYIFVKPMLDEKFIYMLSGKKNPKANDIIYKFNLGLKSLKDSGEYNKILSEYGFD
ncbi:transporter substrate-binding domain-containing protein [Vibrio profundum]|uniref:substrate-binding periplasmic protein n=1 Tax=Vibrio profundum TaxID=2910247 RepID=UPI003D0A3102